MATFYQDAVKQIGTTEEIFHSLYVQEDKPKTSWWVHWVVNCLLALIKLLKSGRLDVNSLKLEAKHAIKELAEVQSELLVSKRERIDILQSGIQTTLKKELKSVEDKNIVSKSSDIKSSSAGVTKETQTTFAASYSV